jgi:diguanylate cyclase (GGDEF)-like protein
MERRRHRVDLRDFLEREVPVSRLSPDLRQRVRHALAGHGDLFTIVAEVVRELLSSGELRRAGTVSDGNDRVVVYSMPRSSRVFDLRTLLEGRDIELPPIPDQMDEPPEEPETPSARPEVEAPRVPAPQPRPSADVTAAGSTPVFRSLRRVLERDWVSFGLESALDALLEEIRVNLSCDVQLLLWGDDGMPTSSEGRFWRRGDESDPEIRRTAVRLREHVSLEPEVGSEIQWWRVHLLTGVAGALGIRGVVDPVVAEEAANLVGSLLMAALRSETRVYQDSLTGLHNRAFFEGQMSVELERAIRLSQPLALLFVDLDHFKQVNDQHGHDVGDLLLEHVARTIAGHLRRIDQVFRWGGEEFVVLLPGTGPEEGYQAAERLRTVLERSPLQLPDGTEIRPTVSIGVALAPEHALGGERAFLRHADQALYAAKESGRNRTVVYGS